MSDDSWDGDGFEPGSVVMPKVVDNWEGEDEDDEVKESWEDFDVDEKNNEEQNQEAVTSSITEATTQKKSLKEKTTEKEDKRRKEVEKQKQAEVTPTNVKMTPEEALTEKLRRQKLQEDADLKLAQEAFGISNDDKFLTNNPSSKEEFDDYRRHLVDTIKQHEKSPYFLTFLDELFRDLCLSMDTDDVKKLSSSLNALVNEKVKAAKALKGKKKPVKKAVLVLGKANDYGYVGDEYDDFM